MVFICTSLMTNEIEHRFMYLLVQFCLLFFIAPIEVFAHFPIGCWSFLPEMFEFLSVSCIANSCLSCMFYFVRFEPCLFHHSRILNEDLPVFLPWEFHGWRSPLGTVPWVAKVDWQKATSLLLHFQDIKSEGKVIIFMWLNVSLYWALCVCVRKWFLTLGL